MILSTTQPKSPFSGFVPIIKSGDESWMKEGGWQHITANPGIWQWTAATFTGWSSRLTYICPHSASLIHGQGRGFQLINDASKAGPINQIFLLDVPYFTGFEYSWCCSTCVGTTMKHNRAQNAVSCQSSILFPGTEWRFPTFEFLLSATLR